ALADSNTIEGLRTAHSIYQGDYLCENCQESWASPTRDQLHQAYLQSSNRLASLLFDSDQWDESMHVCHDILATDPCNEPAFRILMRCHAARGNRSAVHSVYQRCSTALREDLDVEPSGETTALYKQLTR
ncbi:MAG TPA: bacterial transcriptional activator domain-containing protein, partial [Anaerolineaceae bacterium]|nr:bacterial transcriptional activator domain-containing protein [Anaerolineaceae bacterium]